MICVSTNFYKNSLELDEVENRERKNSTLFKVKIKLLDWTIGSVQLCEQANDCWHPQRDMCAWQSVGEHVQKKIFSNISKWNRIYKMTPSILYSVHTKCIAFDSFLSILPIVSLLENRFKMLWFYRLNPCTALEYFINFYLLNVYTQLA